jgi:chromosome segregation ATPase
VVCREVLLDAEGERLRLAADIKSGGMGANPRLECRACWQTFPAPEGLEWEIVSPPASAPTSSPEPQSSSPAPEAPGAEPLPDRFRRLAEGLSELVRLSAEDAIAGLQARLETVEFKLERWQDLPESVANLQAQASERARQVLTLSDELTALRGRLSELEAAAGRDANSLALVEERLAEQARRLEAAETGSAEIAASVQKLGEQLSQSQTELQSWQQAWLSRIANLESALGGISEIMNLLTQLRQEQQSLHVRLDKQAEAIRTLHGAVQERLQRREELQAALQRLEQIASALGETKPLPENL